MNNKPKKKFFELRRTTKKVYVFDLRNAEEFEISYYPFLLEGVALNPELNQADGKHPNIKGIKIISQNLAKKINNLKIFK